MQCTGCLNLKKRPSAHCTRGWVGPRAGLDRCRKSHPLEVETRIVQPTASYYTDCAILAHTVLFFCLNFIQS